MPRVRRSAITPQAGETQLDLVAVGIADGKRAAEAIGTEALQKQTQGRVVLESFTHGSSAQRMEALRRGLQSGDPTACNYAR